MTQKDVQEQLEKDRALRLAQQAVYMARPSEFPQAQIIMTPSDLMRFAGLYAAQVTMDREALIDLIVKHLGSTYHCHRVWNAWNVGTMSEGDFSEVVESDTPAEIADAILTAMVDQARFGGDSDFDPKMFLTIKLENVNEGTQWCATSNHSRRIVVGQADVYEALRLALEDAGVTAQPTASNAGERDLNNDEPMTIAKCLRKGYKAEAWLSGGTGPVACVGICNIQLQGWTHTKETAEGYAKAYNDGVENMRAALACKPVAPPAGLTRVEPEALRKSILELEEWERRADGELLTQGEGESIMLVLHELKTLLTTAPAPAGQTDIEASARALSAIPAPKDEHAAFQQWLERVCPSGDAESVQHQWASSSDRKDWEADQEPDPANDDGAALRLAIDKGLHIGVEHNVVSAWHRDHYGNFHTESFGDDKYAAARRAIVRAGKWAP